MPPRSLSALLVLNVVILAALAVTLFSPAPQALAQIGGPQGNYLMVAGEVRGRNQQQIIYILDLNNQRLAGFMYDSNRDTLITLANRQVNQDIAAGRR